MAFPPDDNYVSFFETGNLFDAIVKSDAGQEFLVHRVIVAAGSRFLERHFTKAEGEAAGTISLRDDGVYVSEPPSVTVRNTPAETLGAVLGWLYGKEFELQDPDKAIDVFLCARYLEIPELTRFSWVYLSRQNAAHKLWEKVEKKY